MEVAIIKVEYGEVEQHPSPFQVDCEVFLHHSRWKCHIQYGWYVDYYCWILDNHIGWWRFGYRM